MLLVGLNYLGELLDLSFFYKMGRLGWIISTAPFGSKKNHGSGPRTPPAKRHAGCSVPVQTGEGARWVGKRKREVGAAMSR